jgi:hypothetical protein
VFFVIECSAAEFKAGFGRVVITPTAPIRMSGYAARNKPSEGVVHDLWAKALAIEDARGSRFVLVGIDLSTVPRNLAEEVARRVQQRHGLPRERLLLNCSHTHAGPVISPNNVYALPEAEGEEAGVVRAYTLRLAEALVEAVGLALRDLAPARLSLARGQAGFAGNRREPTASGIKIGVNPNGPTDHDVPVIAVRAPGGQLRGLLFGYSCHPTTLTGNFYRLCGDYAGFAQAEIEKKHPGTTALFLQLCGGDQNPQPRGTLELAEGHGRELAESVERTLAAPHRVLHTPLRASLQVTELGFAPHTRETFEQRLNDSNKYRAAHARQMLRAYDEGRPIRSIPYPVQALRFGKDLTLVALGGEVVVDYSLRAKREFRPRPGKGEHLIVAGYSNDVMCYIPSLRVLKEGGYEAVDSLVYDGMPGPFDERVEETIFAAMRKALAAVGRPGR